MEYNVNLPILHIRVLAVRGNSTHARLELGFDFFGWKFFLDAKLDSEDYNKGIGIYGTLDTGKVKKSLGLYGRYYTVQTATNKTVKIRKK